MKFMKNKGLIHIGLLAGLLTLKTQAAFGAQATDFYSTPSFLTSQVPPLVMLVMGKNHKLFYEAYNDASDLNEDGVLDVGYKGESEPFTDSNGNGKWDIGENYTDTNGNGRWTAGIDYYGYFDSYKCYSYSGTRFEPMAAPTDGNGNAIKKCIGGNSGYWSGDFLNYVTMSRMDALRKVMYGGLRDVDTTTSTVLQRAYIPQDAHSWGKEYESIARDGFDISEYTPLSLPQAGYYHLFANTTLSDNGTPLLRVLNDSRYRIWEWVSIERPVAGDRCLHGGNGPMCEDNGGASWEIVPASAFVGLTQTTYDISSYGNMHADDHAEFDTMESTYANATYEMGTGPATNIDGSGNPHGSDDQYMTIFEGQIDIPADGTYRFAVDGDDAVEVIIDGNVVASWYGGHGNCNCQTYDGTITLTAGLHNIKFRHEEWSGGDNYYLYWELSNVPVSTMTDYDVRVEVCNTNFPESNCQVYPNGYYKPVGLLQRYGEDEKMFFGMMSGSYESNMSGGVLRKNVSELTDEIDPDTGQILAPAGGGIIDTMDKIRISEFNYGNYTYPGGWVTTSAMSQGDFKDWGNPIGEMMYETIRYFAGKTSPTAAYNYTHTGSMDETLGLSKPAWRDPYSIFEYCASPYMLVMSDIFPTFDSDQLHGVHTDFLGGLAADDFSTGANNHDIMDVSDLAKAITSGEGISGNYYIGEEASLTPDTACTPKTSYDLGDVRGLCPEEPTKEGSYYSAAVAYYGAKYDINPSVPGAQRVSTFVVGLASPLPKIEVDIPDGNGNNNRVTLVPFAKSVGGCLGVNGTQGLFQPTNTIVDFYVEQITPTYGRFSINYEDVEQGADHDMDAIVVYEYQVNGNQIDITLDSTYAAGCIIQHMGYIISGTTADGVYLEVKDDDTGNASDPDYFLDTPPGELPGGTWNDNAALPETTTRTFTVGNTPGATLLENPLYYAAKYGGYIESDETEDENQNGLLDPGEDLNGNGKIDYLSSEDQIVFNPDIPSWHGNNSLDTEDTNGNGLLDNGEDINLNGRLDFEDLDGDNVIDVYNSILPNEDMEWDEDGNGIPDTYFYVVNPLKLEEQISASFAAMLRRASSGTAASVISSSRSGEGAVYQSVFYPEYKDDTGVTVRWTGIVRAMLVDNFGNMRVDMYVDQFGNINTDSVFGVKQINFRTEDVNYNGVFDTNLNEDVNTNGVLDPGEDLNNNGRLDLDFDEVDYDKDGQIDYRDLIVVLSGGRAQLWDDKNENGRKDIEDEIVFSPDYPNWHENGVLDTEDTNGNGVLDPGEDINGNNKLDSEDANGNGVLDHEMIHADYDIANLEFLWNTQDWLDDFAMDPAVQRTYGLETNHRYIFTFVDEDGDMIADVGEQRDFISSAQPSVADLTDTTTMFPYLTLHPYFDDKPAWVDNIEIEGNGDIFRQEQAKRVVDYIRGTDQPDVTIGSYAVPAMRSRQYLNTEKGYTTTWRLGDIVSSSPTLVGRPAENYHLIYRDTTYAYFLARHLIRRNVVYTGGNDGMIHAFNAGFFDVETSTFVKELAEPFIDLDNDGVYDPPNLPAFRGEPFADLNNDGAYTPAFQAEHELGSELWGYVPFNQLPHLYWLTEQNYPHVYFNDLTPKIFDAKIFPYNPNDPLANPDYPYGWGTVMVMGMRFGGGHIIADTNRDGVVDATDKVMKSGYVIMDITNPEEPPKLLAEITLPGLGYTTCFPTVIPMRTKQGSGSNTSFHSNDWYLVFGSGPADANGLPASLDISGTPNLSGTVGEDRILTEGVSDQNSKIFVLNLNQLTNSLGATVEVIDENGAPLTVTSATTSAHMEEFAAESFISQPVTIDYDLNFNADTVYFGTIEWDSTFSSWGGKLKRLVIEDSTITTDWVSTTAGGIDRADNVLMDLTYTDDGNGNPVGTSQPITGAPSAAVGKMLSFDIDGSGTIDSFDRERWVYFGTGRFVVSGDSQDPSQQSYYGVKEPATDPANNNSSWSFTWEEVDRADLLDSTNIEIWDDKSVRNHPAGATIDTWVEMIDLQEGPLSTYKGWYNDFSENNERNLGQAALLGGLLTFTTYKPSSDECQSEGSSNLYATWYQTGTAFFRQIFQKGNYWTDTDGDTVHDKGEMRITKSTSLGEGMALTPNLHTGSQDGSTAYVQTSTGDIITIEQEEARATKSHKTSWSIGRDE